MSIPEEGVRSYSYHSHHLYRHTDFYMLRAPALSASLFSRISADEEISTAGSSLAEILQVRRQHCYELLHQLILQPEIALALAVASSSLEEGLKRLSSDVFLSIHTKKTSATVLRYIIRMCTRPTPFGLFSGVALGTFADQTDVMLASPPLQKLRTRPAITWLLEVLQKIEANDAIVRQMRFRTNQAIYMMGDRVYLHTYQGQENRTFSLRATRVVRKALELARYPISYRQFCDALIETFADATIQQVETLFWRLWANQLLISDLRPPLTHNRPAHYVYDYLTNLEGTEAFSQPLGLVLEGARAIDVIGTRSPISLLHNLSQQQRVLASGTKDRQPQVQIDAAIQLSSSHLHHSIGRAAAMAAEILLRLSPAPEGRQALREYRHLFVERYGVGAEVPLLDLLSAEKGLDAPRGYEQPQRTYYRPATLPVPDTGSRERILQKLLANAINGRSLEIELDRQLLQQLESWTPQLARAPYSLEMYLQVHARSYEALDRGEWCIVVNQGNSLAAGRTFGRFVDILGDEGMQSLREMFSQEEGLNPQAIFAELNYQPRYGHSANVMIRSSLRSYEIAFGTTPSLPPERVIPLDDLVVGVKNARFYLRSRRLNKQVIVCINHMFNMKNAPNACRFMVELAEDGSPILASFPWGDIRYSPFLPRVKVRSGPSSSIVLSPAQWFVEADTIAPGGAEDEETNWFQGVQSWREQWRVPRYVYLAESDARLLLDLEHPLMVAELRTQVAKLEGEARIQLQEVLPGFDALWLRDERGEPYFSEIVVPLLRADAPETERKAKSETVYTPMVLSQQERCVFPGEDWLYLKVYVAYRLQNKLIALHIKELLDQLAKLNCIDNWFFVRYGDPEPHLRLRFHMKGPETFQHMLTTVLQWSCQLARKGIIQCYGIDTYAREVERYGGPRSIALLEQVFGSDSTVICGLLRAQRLKQLTLDAQMIAVFTLDYLLAAWGWNFQQRLLWLRKHTRQYEANREFRPVRKIYSEFLSPWTAHSEHNVSEQRAYLLELLKSQGELVAQIGTQIRALVLDRSLCTSEDELVASLLHMHCNRLLGVDRALERQTYAFWRLTLEAIDKRPPLSCDGC